MAKNSPRITAGELQRLDESWGQKPIYIYIYIYICTVLSVNEYTPFEK